MKAVKFSVAAAAALALSTAALADGPVVYGKQNVEVGSFESGATVGGPEMGAKTHSSRFGIKGSVDMEDGLTGLYQIEIQHDLIGGVADIGSGARNSFLGISGDFGTFIAGNHDHPSKLALYKSGAGVFAPDTTAKLVQTELRSSPAAAYVNSFGDMTLAVAAVFTTDADDATKDATDLDVAVWGAAGDLKYGVGVIMPDAADDPLLQLSAGMTMGSVNVGASIEQMTDVHMAAIVQANMDLGGGLYAGVGAKQVMWDITGLDDNTDMGITVGKKWGEKKAFDTYLAVKMHGDGHVFDAKKLMAGTAPVLGVDGTDVAIGLTASF